MGNQVLPNPSLAEETHRRVQATIDWLKLNDRECTAARENFYDDFAKGKLPFDVLEKKSPFVARELRRQGLYPAA